MGQCLSALSYFHIYTHCRPYWQHHLLSHLPQVCHHVVLLLELCTALALYVEIIQDQTLYLTLIRKQWKGKEES